jgi:hypothetical protein
MYHAYIFQGIDETEIRKTQSKLKAKRGSV